MLKHRLAAASRIISLAEWGIVWSARLLVEDNTVRSAPTLLLSGRVGYQWSKGVRLALEGFNLLNRQDSQIAYYCESRLRGAAAGPGASGRPPRMFISTRPSRDPSGYSWRQITKRRRARTAAPIPRRDRRPA